MTGYELLADKLGEGLSENQPASKRDMVVPVYRKFENLNHRILLHLQDEIAELEEELRFMDEYIAQNSLRTEAGHLYPASRRNETRFGNEVYRRRTELLGRIYIKLGQYSKLCTTTTFYVSPKGQRTEEDEHRLLHASSVRVHKR